MKRLLLILFLIAVTFSPAQTPNAIPSRPRIGLALSGGGARGFAHIGILKTIDSLGLPVDYIAGTSMGGLIGALYAIGYSGAELERIALETNWNQLFSDQLPRNILPYPEKKETDKYQLVLGLKNREIQLPSGLIRGQKITQMLSRLTYAFQNVKDFDRLPIPFRCVAIDLISSRKVVLSKGSLSKAMRATMSLPTIFYPVSWGDSLLIDGGMMDNLPVDVVREMGANIVIAVNVGEPQKSKEELNNIIDIVGQIFSLANTEAQEWALANADLVLTPPLGSMTGADFDKADIRRAIRRGHRVAADSLAALLEIRHITDPTHIHSADRAVVDSTRLYGVQIAGNTTLPFALIDSLLGLRPGMLFNADTLKAHMYTLRRSGLFKTIKGSVQAVDSLHYKALITVTETQKPHIARVTISGQKILSFRFIYNLIGIHPGTVFDPELIDRRITQLYSLGYFETIYYDIKPLSENRITIHFHVSEKPRRELRVGIKYDDLYNLTMAIGVQGTNVLIPGLRMENELLFPEYLAARFKVFYPSRSLTFPIYPFVHLGYRDIPIDIYDNRAHLVARYPYRSADWAVGIGVQAGSFINAELELNFEYMDIEPEVALPDPVLFPSWKNRLRTLRFSNIIDQRDNTLIPRRGYLLSAKYEGSFVQLLSSDRYYKFNIIFENYLSLTARHTVRFYGFYGQASQDIPVYKNFYLGGPKNFVGLEYFQLTGQKIGIVRLDWRYRFSERWYGTLIANSAYDERRQNERIVGGTFRWMHALGAALTLDTPFGPFEVTYAYNFNSFYANKNNESYLYFRAGYNF